MRIIDGATLDEEISRSLMMWNNYLSSSYITAERVPKKSNSLFGIRAENSFRNSFIKLFIHFWSREIAIKRF